MNLSLELRANLTSTNDVFEKFENSFNCSFFCFTIKC